MKALIKCDYVYETGKIKDSIYVISGLRTTKLNKYKDTSKNETEFIKNMRNYEKNNIEMRSAVVVDYGLLYKLLSSYNSHYIDGDFKSLTLLSKSTEEIKFVVIPQRLLPSPVKLSRPIQLAEKQNIPILTQPLLPKKISELKRPSASRRRINGGKNKQYKKKSTRRRRH